MDRKIQLENEELALEHQGQRVGLAGSEDAELEPGQPMPLDGRLDPSAAEASAPEMAWPNEAASGAAQNPELANREVAAGANQDDESHRATPRRPGR